MSHRLYAASKAYSKHDLLRGTTTLPDRLADAVVNGLRPPEACEGMNIQWLGWKRQWSLFRKQQLGIVFS